MRKDKNIFFDDGKWHIQEAGKPTPPLTRSWLVSVNDEKEEFMTYLVNKVLERSSHHEGHLIWLGSWTKVKQGVKTPILGDKTGKTYLPARILLASQLGLSYSSLPFPISPFCDIGKHCVLPEHQKPYVPVPAYHPDRLQTFKDVTAILNKQDSTSDKSEKVGSIASEFLKGLGETLKGEKE